MYSIRRFSESFFASDLSLTRRARGLVRDPAAHRYFATVSRLGDGVIWYALMLGLLSFGGQIGQRVVLQMAILGLASLALYKTLKRVSRRPRPLAVEQALANRVAPLDEFSFPSGHTLHAVGFTLVLTQQFPMAGLILWPFCASIALSRVVLGLHFPTDVIAAIALGWGMSEVSAKLMWLVLV